MIRPIVAPDPDHFDALFFPAIDSANTLLKPLSKAWGKNGRITVLPVSVHQQYNTSFAYGWNDGAMVPAKGYQAVASAGVYLRKGMFEPELREWLARRCPDTDDVRTALVLNTALAAFTTAADAWEPHQPYDLFLELLENCLRWAGAGLARS